MRASKLILPVLAFFIFIFYQNCTDIKIASTQQRPGSTCDDASRTSCDTDPSVDPNPEPGPEPEFTPTPVSTTSIPGWTGQTPSPNSCLPSGGVLPTSEEPEIPEACLSIPGIDSTRPYPIVYLEYNELVNGGPNPLVDEPRPYMSAEWWNQNFNEGLLTRDMSWTHVGQAPRVCEANSGSIPISIAAPGRYYITPNNFYSVRLTPEEGEGGLIFLENINGEAAGMVSISECPGDFGRIIDANLMRDIRMGVDQGSLPTPAINTRNVNRTLYYQASTEKTYNQYIPPQLRVKYYAFERCIKEDPRRGFELAYKTTDSPTGDSRIDSGCRLQAGKTYYINYSTRVGFDNRPRTFNSTPMVIFTGIERRCLGGVCPQNP